MMYKEVLEKMFAALPMFQRVGAAAYKPDLSNTLRLMDSLGHPYRNFKSIHVAGTNGKGSCSHILASVLQEAGYKTGLYTSPHLRDFRERIRIDGQMIPKEEVVAFYEKNEELFTRQRTSFFEMTVALAFDYFAAQKVDIAVIETGMGGRLDSTNVITPEVSLITNISPDHMQFLGDTLPKIAVEKAGIIKPGVPAVISETQPEVKPVFDNAAARAGSPIVYADAHYALQNISNNGCGFGFDVYKDGVLYGEGWHCDLPGDTYESKNVAGVLAVLEILKRRGWFVNDGVVKRGLACAAEKTGLSGRWQCLQRNPSVYCDTGHNEAGIKLVLEQIKKMPHNRLHIVWGMVKDKDIDHILPLLPPQAEYYFTQAGIERALDAEILRQKAAAYNLRGQVYRKPQDALDAARKACGPDDLVYVGGSTFVVAEIC